VFIQQFQPASLLLELMSCMESHSITNHLAEVTFPSLPRQLTPVLDLATRVWVDL